MGDTGAWQHTEIGPVGWQWDGMGGWKAPKSWVTDPEERLDREAPIDKVCLIKQPR